MTALEVLRTIRERLLRLGWQQFHYGNDHGPNCIIGAINHEAALASAGAVFTLMRALIAVVVVDDSASIISWNDERDRTLADVLDALDWAESLLMSEAQS